MSTTYVPILSDKLAELHALAEMSQALTERTVPLVVLRHPEPTAAAGPGWNPESALRKRAVHPTSGLVGCWGSDRPLFLDLSSVDFEAFERTQIHPAERFLDLCASTGLALVPVVGRRVRRETTQAIVRAVRRLDNGACIRLSGEDVGVGVQGTTPLLRELDLPRTAVDLVIDLETVPASNTVVLARVAGEFLKQLEPATGWRSVTLVGSSFPADLYRLVEHDSHEIIPRVEQDVWRSATRLDPVLEHVRYGDYGVVAANPEPGFRGAANVRYAVAKGWLVLRGFPPEKAPPDDYVRLGRRLVEMGSLWRGPAHCSGCRFIADRVNAGTGGNSTQWRQAGFAHHFATVASA